MQVNISARHLELTEALNDYVLKKVQKCERFFDHIVWAQVILCVEKHSQQAELIIHAGKMTFRAQEESLDLYAAIDLAVDKMEKQLRKYKEITKVHRKKKNSDSLKKAIAVDSTVIELGENHIITEVKRFDIKPISIHEAIEEMHVMGHKFHMFLNSNNSKINVVFLRDNGSYGLLEPEA